MSTISTESTLTRLPLAVYARFKSVNFFKYYKQTNYNFVEGNGPLDPLNPALLKVKVTEMNNFPT